MIPNRYFFGQHQNEKLIFYVYKHWASLLKKIFGGVLFICFSILIFYIWVSVERPANQNIFLFLSQHPIIVLSFYSLFLFHIHSFFMQVFNYIFNTIIVTDCRFIEVRRSVFFEDNRESLDLAKIQDIQAHKNGFFENVFNYGEIHFTFATIQDPKIVIHIKAPVEFIEYINILKRKHIFKHEQLEEHNIVPQQQTEREIII